MSALIRRGQRVVETHREVADEAAAGNGSGSILHHGSGKELAYASSDFLQLGVFDFTGGVENHALFHSE